MIIKETIKKEISLTIDDIKDLNIEEKEGVIVDYTDSVSTSVYDSEEVFTGIYQKRYQNKSNSAN